MPRRNYHHGGYRLGNLVSWAGMRYIMPASILQRPRRNEIILSRLKEAGVVLTKQNVDAEFARVVRVAREMLAANNNNDNNKLPDELTDFLEAVQERLPPWAAGLSGATFLELFWRLVQARDQWKKNPAPPFGVWEQSPIAAEVDGLLAANEQCLDWIKTEVEIFELANGFGDEEEDEAEAEGMDVAGSRDIEMGGTGGAIAELEHARAAQRAMEEEIPGGVEMMDLS